MTATENKLGWCAMVALSVAVNTRIASEIVVAYHGEVISRRDSTTAYGQARLLITDYDLAVLDGHDGEREVKSSLIDRLLADVNPLALGMA